MDLVAIKKLFFDRKAVTDKLDPAERKALSKFGAYVRTRSRSSIRSRKKTSAPGQPPSSHVGTLKRLIFFGYDASAKSVVVGPVLGGNSPEAPRVLEEGGPEKLRSGKTGHYRARPYMRPAFEAELAKVGGNFKNLIR